MAAGKKKTSPDSLTTNEQLFCDHYLSDCTFNGTKAAIAAGYSKKTAAAQASRLLRKVKVQNYLSAKIEKVTTKLEISQERTMQEIGRLAFSSIKCLFNEDGSLKKITDLTEEEAAILSSVEIEEITAGYADNKASIGFTKKLKLWDKPKALEMLAKHYKIFSDAPIVNSTLKFGYGEEKPV